MHVVVGRPSPIRMTARHLANRAPSVAYSASRSRSPSSPSVMTSSGKPANGFVPPSTLMPGITPWRRSTSGNGVPSAAFWRSVSSNRITPLMASPIPAVVKRISRYARRFCSVDSTPMPASRFAIVGALSSAARIPLPGATNARAVWLIASRFIVRSPSPLASDHRPAVLAGPASDVEPSLSSSLSGRTDSRPTEPPWSCGSGSARVGREQPPPVRDRDGLGAPRRAQLGQDVRDVDAHGLAADEQPLADLPVRQALSHEREDLRLPTRQCVDGRRTGARQVEPAAPGERDDGCGQRAGAHRRRGVERDLCVRSREVSVAGLEQRLRPPPPRARLLVAVAVLERLGRVRPERRIVHAQQAAVLGVGAREPGEPLGSEPAAARTALLGRGDRAVEQLGAERY